MIDSVAFARLLETHGRDVSFAFVWELTPLIGLTITISPASGIETEGHDPEEGHGAKHESPTAAGGDAQ